MSQQDSTNLEEKLSDEELIKRSIASLATNQIIIKSAALNTIINFGSKSVPYLVKELTNEYWSIRDGVIEALMEIGDQSAIDPLLSVLNDEDQDFKGKVALALGRLKAHKALKVLLALLHDDYEFIRENAARGLGEIGDKRATQPLVRAMNDSDVYVRAAIATSLGQLKDFNATERLLRSMRDRNETVRKASTLALGSIKDPKSIVPLIQSFYIPGTNSEVKETIIEAIKNFDETIVKENIIKYSNEDKNVEVEVIEELLFFIHYDDMLIYKEEMKTKLIKRYSRMLRRQVSEVQAVLAFIQASFIKLRTSKDIDAIDVLKNSIPRNRKIIEKVSYSDLRKLKWTRKELYFELKKAQEAFNEGMTAINEIEIAIKNKLQQLGVKVEEKAEDDVFSTVPKK